MNPWVDEERCANTWKERLFALVETGDAYILCDGATGTLTELLVVWEMTNKGLLDKPILILGDFLKSLVRHLKDRGSVQMNSHLRLVSNAEEAILYLKKFWQLS